MKKILTFILIVTLSMLSFTGCKDNIEDDLGNAESIIGDSTVDYEERLETSENFVQDFLEYLKTDASYSLSGVDIADKYSSVMNVEVVNKTDNDTYRIFWVMGDPSLYGSLEKEWTFIQWKDGDKIYAYQLETKSGKKAQSAIINNNKIAILGYDNMYANKYIYVSLFEVSGNEVKDVTPNSELSSKDFMFECSENDVYITSSLFRELSFENTGEGFKIEDLNSEMYLTFDDNLYVK